MNVLHRGPYWATESQIRAAQQFANEHEDHYARGQPHSNPAKFYQDKLWGKLAEFAVEDAIRYMGGRIVQPVSCRIEPIENRGHMPDLVVVVRGDVVQVSVKFCPIETTSLYGTSWTWQWGDGRRDPIFYDPEIARDRLEVLTMQLDARCIWIAGRARAEALLPYMREPAVPALREQKRVVYLDDLHRVAPLEFFSWHTAPPDLPCGGNWNGAR